jgi:hypothetical protein
LQAIPIVLAIVVVNFFLLHMAEGDAVDVLAGEAGSATPEYMAELRKKFGLDQPLPVQLVVYLKNVLTVDLGYSFRHEMPVLDLVLDRFIPTLLLMVSTIVLAVGVGIILGLLAASGLNTWRDNLISVFALVTYATPLFWVGLMFIVVFALNLGWFPTSGMENIAMFYTGWDRFWDIAHHLVLPTITLSLFYLALYTRLMRASMLEQADMDYVTTARQKQRYPPRPYFEVVPMTQDEALHLLKLGKNIFLTGSAGSGKTYLLNSYIRYLKRHGVGVSVTASTGLAATHLNGRTIHSWSGIGVSTDLSEADLATLQREKGVRNRYQKTKVLIIDEVSMLHAFQLDLVDRIARKMLDPLQPFGGLQVVLCGDFFQLPPVKTQRDTSPAFAFESLAWQQGKFCTCYLHEQHRQGNDALVTVLNDIRNGAADERTKAPLRTRYKQQPIGAVQATRLYARNVSVDAINQRELDALSGDEIPYHMTKHGSVKLTDALLRGCPAPTTLKLKIGAWLCLLKTPRMAAMSTEHWG